jgi:L-alanine-DL-glutamate epimerase-like enolase superfamily enzyme
MTARIDRVAASAYRVPTEQPEADGTAAWDATVVVVVRVAAGGHEGLGFSYGDASAAEVVSQVLRPLVLGADVAALPAVRDAMDREARNRGRDGVVACAISALDIALWDLRARLLGVPLLELLGRARPAAPMYGSGGFTTFDDETTAAQLRGWVDAGCRAVKIKIGESRGAAEDRDLHRVRLARETVGDLADVFVDANGGYSPGQARRVERELRQHGVRWFEEPVSSEQPEELAAIRAASRMDVAAGEYCWRLEDAGRMLAARAVDCLQLDVTRCGGISGWLAGAAAAAAHGLDVSAHCAPQLSAHVVCAARNARHGEYFADHARLEALLFDGVLPLRDGALTPTAAAGHGLTLAEGAQQYRIGGG